MGDSYAEPAETGSAPYGNNELTETNVISIAQLKSKFANYIATDYRDGVSYAKVTDDIKIKAIVTSSDVAGNIYQEVAFRTQQVLLSLVLLRVVCMVHYLSARKSW